MQNKFVPVNEFKFMRPFENDSINGLHLNNIYIHEEIIVNILSYVPPKKLLKLTLVCKKWCNIIKSEYLWMNIYNKCYPSKAKKLPWYVYYCYFATDNFENLLKNWNGEIEEPSAGADQLPLDDLEFIENSYIDMPLVNWKKMEIVSFVNKRLLRYILNTYTPHINASEWTTGRYDFGCIYTFIVKGYNQDFKIKNVKKKKTKAHFYLKTSTKVEQWQESQWEKLELLATEYPPDVAVLVFEHEAEFWSGVHYRTKIAGGAVRILFDSIQPLEDKLETDVDQFDENCEIEI